MSVFEKYPNLPGFATEFKDGGLVVRTEVTPPGTESILLLGTSMDGPVGEPVAVDPSTVEMIYGGARKLNGASNGTTLVRGFHEAFAAGCRDIRLMRISGSESKTEFPIVEESKTVDEQVDLEILVDQESLKNTETTKDVVIQLGATYITGSAKFKDLTSEDYTVVEVKDDVDNPEKVTKITVTLNAKTVQTKKGTKLEYKVTNSKGVEETKADTVMPDGADVKLTFTKKVDDGFHLYHNARLVSQDKYKIAADGLSVTVNAGTIALAADVEVSYIYRHTEEKIHTLTLQSAFGGQVYDDTKVTLKKEGERVRLTIVKPESKKRQVSEPNPTYTSSDYPTLEDLVQAINADTNNNVVRATINESAQNISTVRLLAEGLSDDERNLSGGDNGLDLSKYQIYEILGGKRSASGQVEDQGVYHLLENYTVDMIVPLGVYADDKIPGKYNNFASQLALACAVISHRNHTTTGVIATSSPDEAGLSSVKSHFDHLMSHKNDYFMRDASGHVINDTNSGKPMDLGRFISVVAGPDVILNTDGLRSYAENSAGGYAGFVSKLAPQSAPTNKITEHARGLRYSFSNAQLDALTAARYVTFRYKGAGAAVAVVDGPTAAQPDSDYRRISTTRVVKEVVNELRDVCDTYIGEPNEIPQRNAMSAAIAKRLERLKEAGIIVDFSFTVVATPAMRMMGEAKIELTIIPPMELRKITTVVSLRPGL